VKDASEEQDSALPGVATNVVRAQNSALLLRMLWRERQLTRVEIAKRTGLSHSTVSAIVQDLERAGLVQTLGAMASRGGRPPQLIGFRDDAFALLGVEIGARHVAVVLSDLRGRVLCFEEQRHRVRADPDGTLALVRTLLDGALRKERFPLRKVVGIGVAVPSPVDSTLPGQLSELIFPAWRGVDVGENLRRTYGVPVFVDNDANLGALAEHWWGLGTDQSDLAYIKVGAGVGAGFILRGELYRGGSGKAGEIGHVAIDSNGPTCVCGNRGCLTTFIGSEELSARAQDMLGSDVPLTLAEIVRRARSGDPLARALVDDVGERLGIVVGTLLNTMDVPFVVIGGEISSVGDMLLDAVRLTVRKRALPSTVAQTKIMTSNLGPQATAVGAATLVLSMALGNQQLFPEHGRGIT
jgi:predicted NBD/HSP70 family sugar kinase